METCQNFHRIIVYQHRHWIVSMRSFILIFCLMQVHFEYVDAFFRTHLSKFTAQMKVKHTNLDPNGGKNKKVSKCMMPCQLQPHWVPFEQILAMSGIPIYLHTMIRSKSEMINVGKCIGQCSSTIRSIYPQAVRHLCSKISSISPTLISGYGSKVCSHWIRRHRNRNLRR